MYKTIPSTALTGSKPSFPSKENVYLCWISNNIRSEYINLAIGIGNCQKNVENISFMKQYAQMYPCYEGRIYILSFLLAIVYVIN